MSMEEFLERVCYNCEYSRPLSEDASVCFKKKEKIVRNEGRCRSFTPDLLKFVPSSLRVSSPVIQDDFEL